MMKISLLPLLILALSCEMPFKGDLEDPTAEADSNSTFVDPVGVLDTSFATSGIYNDNTVAYTGSYIGKQSTGKIVVLSKNGNSWVVTRFTSAGALDASFGTAGVLSLDQGASINIKDIVIDSNDRITLIGQTRLVQLNSDGSTNTSFATAGTYAVAGLAAYAAVIDSAGNLWLGGHSGLTLALQKITNAGVLVNTYYPVAGSTQCYGLAIDADDNLYQTGIISSGGWKGLVAKILPDGTADSTFGLNTLGWVAFTEAGGYADTKDAIILDDGSIIVSGVMDVTRFMFMAKITATGELDLTFGGGDGFVIEAFSGTTANSWYQGWEIQQLPNGKILVAGNNANDGVVAKYDTDGNIDTAFGSSGYFNLDINAQADIIEAFLVNDDGSVVVTGYSADKLYVAKFH